MKVLLLLVPVILGGIFFLLAHWVRRKNREINQSGRDVRQIDGLNDLLEGKLREGASRYFFSNVSPFWEGVGRFLIVFTIVGVVGLLIFVAMKLHAG
jgi:hypothetical protein